VVITGSTKGLGKALAKEFLSYGDNVVINGRSSEAVAKVVQELQSKAGLSKVLGVSADASDAEQMQRVAEAAKKEFGRIDFWINNAGQSQSARAPLHQTSPSVYESIVQCNLLGSMNGARAATNIMLGQASGFGALRTRFAWFPQQRLRPIQGNASHKYCRGQVFLMEGAGSRGGSTALSAAYGASKAALPQLAKTLKKELKSENVSPSFTGVFFPSAYVPVDESLALAVATRLACTS